MIGGGNVSPHWGVDSAALVTKELYHCVLYKFGKPEFWGRHLSTVQGASEGITAQEVQLLHNSGIKVIPIYYDFLEAIGYDRGKTVAINTIFHARRLGIPKGKVLFANVERFFQVDSDWICGFVDAFIPSGYLPGIFQNPVTGDFNQSYCQAVSENPKVANELIIWSAEPKLGVTTRKDAPTYNPIKPNCRANIWGWQYGRDAETYPIDTNLIVRKLFNLLW